MIEFVSIKTCTAIWNIDGKIFRFQRRKAVDDAQMQSYIEKYIYALKNAKYNQNSELISDIAHVLPDTVMLHIGLELYNEEFMQMFEFFSQKYLDKWFTSEAKFGTNKISTYSVFELMFRNNFIWRENSYRDVLKCAKNDNRIFHETFRNLINVRIRNLVKNCVKTNQSLSEIKYKIGLVDTVNAFCELNAEMKEKYINERAQGFTKGREIISLKKVYDEIFGKSNQVINESRLPDEFIKLCKTVVEKEYKIQCKKFPAENLKHIHTNQDKWKMFYMYGPSLNSTTIDFGQITSPSLRQEIKYFMKYRYYIVSSPRDAIVNSLITASNILAENNPKIHYFADIDDVDARKLYMSLEKRCNQDNGMAVSNIMRLFGALSLIIEYLMSDEIDKEILTPKPHKNVFSNYTFHNVKEYKKRTEIIPKDVSKQIENHILEIPQVFELMYRVFSETGMRMKEVQFLEYDCIKDSRYSDFKLLEYKQYKTIVSRRKRGLPDYHQIMVTNALAEELQKFVKTTENSRKTSGLPYIFLKQHKNGQMTMVNMNNYVLTINKLIKKHNICDTDGELWHFTSKQQRKTLAVTLIENGASVDELAYWLGHLSRSTASNYYAEVRKARLAELNTEFFKKKFELEISEEQLKSYSEEERKLLYVDFCLEERQVEFGVCLRKLADGACDKRNSIINCVNCKNLCTGKKYLSYWQKMKEEQEKMVRSLEEYYAEKGIFGYKDFREYRQAMILLEGYCDIIKKITGSEAL